MKLINLFDKEKNSTDDFDFSKYNQLFVDTVQALKAQQLHITGAESLTAGMFQATIASVPGASNVFDGGFVTYALKMKAKLLKIDEQGLYNNGVVSTWTAKRMATHSSREIGADIGVGLTGVAGPDELEGNPAGTVFIGVDNQGFVETKKFNFSGDRQVVRQKSVVAAFIMVLNSL